MGNLRFTQEALAQIIEHHLSETTLGQRFFYAQLTLSLGLSDANRITASFLYVSRSAT